MIPANDGTASLTGIILAGGQGRRIGCPKAFLTIRERPLLDLIAEQLRPACGEILVVIAGSTEAATPCPPSGLEITGEIGVVDRLPLPANTRVVRDLVPDRGPLGGLVTGLSAMSGEWAFVVGCDAPLVSHRMALALGRRAIPLRVDSAAPRIEQSSWEYDIVIPAREGRLQPLQALYHRRVVPVAFERIRSDRLRLMDLLADTRLRVRTVTEDEWIGDGIDPASLLNINTAGDLTRLLALPDTFS